MSKFSLISKLFEKLLCNQLQKYLFDYDLHARCQSAYRVCHITETAILRGHNDVMCSLDKRRDAILIILDLHAVFDTIDDDILLHRIHTKVCIKGTALK